MVSNYKRKIPALPHSRKSKRYYFELLRAIYRKDPIDYAASQLATSPSNIRASMWKVRRVLRRSSEVIEIIREEYESRGLPDSFKYDMWRTFLLLCREGDYSDDMGSFHYCFSRCPIKARPRSFVSSHVLLAVHDGPNFRFVFPDVKNWDEMRMYMSTNALCRECTVNSDGRAYHAKIPEDPQILTSLAWHISQFRVSDHYLNRIYDLYIEGIENAMLDEVLKYECRHGCFHHNHAEVCAVEKTFNSITRRIADAALHLHIDDEH